MELWGFNCISFDEKTSDAFGVGARKQITALFGQGWWSLVTAQEQDPWKWLHQVTGKWQLHPLYAKPKAWAQESLPSFPDVGQRSGLWYMWGYPQAGSVPPWGSVGSPNWLLASGTAPACISCGISVNQQLSPGCSKACIGLSSWSKRVLYTEAWLPGFFRSDL